MSAKRGTGIPELVHRIIELLPSALQDAFIAQQRVDIALKEKRVRALIYSKAGVCAAVALVPIPVADILVFTPIQMAMVATIGYFHGVEVTAERASELLGVMGAGVGLREAARQLVKLVPGYGMVVSASIAFAGTVALGEAANLWFLRKMKVDAQDLKELFTRTAESAKREYALRTRDGGGPSACRRGRIELRGPSSEVGERHHIASRVRQRLRRNFARRPSLTRSNPRLVPKLWPTGSVLIGGAVMRLKAPRAAKPRAPLSRGPH